VLVVMGVTCVAVGLFVYKQRDRLSYKSLEKPGNCDQVLSASSVFRNYEKTLSLLRLSKSVSEAPHALCFVSNISSVGNNPKLAYRDIVFNYRNPDILYTALKSRLNELLVSDRELGSGRGSKLAWPGGWLSEAALVGYKRTGQQRFLDLFVDYYDNVLERRDDKMLRFDDFHKKVMKAWGSVNLTEGRRRFDDTGNETPWVSHITHNARIVLPGTEFALIVKSSPSLSRYSLKADHYVKVAEEVLEQFNSDRVFVQSFPDLVWYNRPVVDKHEPTNHMHMVARVWANLFLLTGNKGYKDAVEGVIEVFAAGLKKQPGGLVSWSYAPVFVDQKQRRKYSNEEGYSEPIWKATHTTQFILQASAQGYLGARIIAPDIAKILSRLTFQGDRAWTTVASRGGAYFDPDREGLNPNFVALITYGSIESEIKNKVSRLVASRPDVFPRAWLFDAGLFAYANLL